MRTFDKCCADRVAATRRSASVWDESNVLESGFLERMNTLLANGEVPGLFEGEEYTTLNQTGQKGGIAS